MFKLIPKTETILRRSWNSEINDFEDAVIDFSSYKNEIDYIITRNLDDFKKGNVKL
jgi:hypothetical protein